VSTLRPLRRLRRRHRNDPQGPDPRLRLDAKNVGHGEILNPAYLVLILKIRLPVIYRFVSFEIQFLILTFGFLMSDDRDFI
jgi:hypothetical protein